MWQSIMKDHGCWQSWFWVLTKNTCGGYILTKMRFSWNENVHTLYYVPAKFQIYPIIQNVTYKK